MRDGGCPAGSSRAQRLDPFALPVRFSTVDDAADDRTREVELHRERVIVRRAVSGMRMALNLPITAFSGVGLTVVTLDGRVAVAVMLAHHDGTLNLPLHLAAEPEDAVAAWQNWADVLGLPLLIRDERGVWRAPSARLGALHVGRPRPRRRRRSALCQRRPSILMRRLPGRLSAATPVHRGEREIIARN
jgi:hypothetical protein